MKPMNTHPLVATTDELNSEQISTVSELGECAPNDIISEFHQREIESISEAFFSADTVPMDPKRLRWLTREYCDFMGRAQAKQRFLFSTAVTIIAYLAPLFIWKIGPFSALNFDDRVRALKVFERRKIGRLLIPVRAILCLMYYEHPDAAQTLGISTERRNLVQVRQK